MTHTPVATAGFAYGVVLCVRGSGVACISAPRRLNDGVTVNGVLKPLDAAAAEVSNVDFNVPWNDGTRLLSGRGLDAACLRESGVAGVYCKAEGVAWTSRPACVTCECVYVCVRARV